MTREEATTHIKEWLKDEYLDSRDRAALTAIIEESERKEELQDKIRAEIAEEKEHAYADFERYKVEYLGQDWEDALDSLPQDDFRYGMERCIEIIDEYRAEREGEQEIKKGGEHG